MSDSAAHHSQPLLKRLYVQVLIAILLGVFIGHFFPHIGSSLQPLGAAFIKLIKLVVAPIIFCTVVTGIAGMQNMKAVGKTGGYALVYFEVLSTLALIIGLTVVNVIRPGSGMHVDPTTLDSSALSAYTTAAEHSHGVVAFMLNLIPETMAGAFAKGDVLQVLFLAILFGYALHRLGERGRPLFEFIEHIAQVMFNIINVIMKVAPLGALGAMAFTISRYGVGSLVQLGFLICCFYLTCVLFVLLVLGIVARLNGFSILKYLRYIGDELLIVMGTSSSEAALPRMIGKMERLGADKSVVGLVIPTGYSFNLDGTSLYLTMAAVFIAQATDTPLNIGHQLTLLAVLLLASKGAAGVSGSGFVVLAATLSAVGNLPVAGLALILGIDWFMSMARALTNLIGNGVATLVVAKWVGQRDDQTLARELDQGPRPAL